MAHARTGSGTTFALVVLRPWEVSGEAYVAASATVIDGDG
jgi:hypothetical protein